MPIYSRFISLFLIFPICLSSSCSSFSSHRHHATKTPKESSSTAGSIAGATAGTVGYVGKAAVKVPIYIIIGVGSALITTVGVLAGVTKSHHKSKKHK